MFRINKEAREGRPRTDFLRLIQQPRHCLHYLPSRTIIECQIDVRGGRGGGRAERERDEESALRWASRLTSEILDLRVTAAASRQRSFPTTTTTTTARERGTSVCISFCFLPPFLVALLTCETTHDFPIERSSQTELQIRRGIRRGIRP